MRDIPPCTEQDIADLEADVIVEHQLVEHCRHPFREDVAQALYQAWLADKSDTRIVIYFSQVIVHGMINHYRSLEKFDYDEVFQHLTLTVMHKLPSYDPSKGKDRSRPSLFPYLSMVINFAILELIRSRKHRVCTLPEQVELGDEQLIDDDATYILNDFLRYLSWLSEEEGETGARIIHALIGAVKSPTINIQRQCHLVDAVVASTRLPRKIVEPYIIRLTEAYLLGSACA